MTGKHGMNTDYSVAPQAVTRLAQSKHRMTTSSSFHFLFLLVLLLLLLLYLPGNKEMKGFVDMEW